MERSRHGALNSPAEERFRACSDRIVEHAHKVLGTGPPGH
jgi:hypothetical protein